MCGCALGTDAVIGEETRIVSGAGGLRLFVIARAIARHRTVGSPGYGLYAGSGGRHDEEISEIAIPPHSAHLSHGKAFYGGMFIAVARTIVTTGDGVGTYLNHTERCGGTGKSLSQSVISAGSIDIGAGSDERIDRIGRTATLSHEHGRHEDHNGHD